MSTSKPAKGTTPQDTEREMTKQQAIDFFVGLGFEYIPDPLAAMRPRNGTTGRPTPRNGLAGELTVSPSRPASQLEYVDPFTGRQSRIAVDPYADSPPVDFVRKLLPSANFDRPPPQPFATGPLPAITASGTPPETLRLLRFDLRHAAAYAQSRVGVLRLLEQQDDELSRQRLLDDNTTLTRGSGRQRHGRRTESKDG